jgi:endonuclease/exonuclease/phosphatase (EEP) superfamily protein YafD
MFFISIKPNIQLLKKTVSVICWLLLMPPGLLLVFRLLAALPGTEASSVLRAISYFPPVWAFFISLLISLGCILANHSRLGLGLSIVGISIFAADGDHRLAEKIFQFEPIYAQQEKAEHHELTVLALNAQCYQHGVRKVAQYIGKSKAHVVLLSENCSSTKKQLIRVLDSSWQFLGHKQKTAILSRLPVVDFQVVELPTREISLTRHNQPADFHSISPTKNRTFLHARLEFNDRAVHFVSLRFIAGRAPSHHPLDKMIWGLQLFDWQEEELDYVDNYLENLKGPIILGGDLNAPPGSYPIKQLSKRLHDSRLATHTLGGFTFRNTTLPTLRLDYLFHSSHFRPLQVEIPQIRLSDHFPMIGRFAMKTAH